MLAPPFAWLAGVSDAFPGTEEPEPEEEAEKTDNAVAVDQMTAHLPVCAENCEDGELFYRTLCAWAVPWSKAPLATFLPAWFRVSANRRRNLLRNHMCYTDELHDPKKWRPHAHFPVWVDRMCARNDVRMLRALAATEPTEPQEPPQEAEQGGGVFSRSARYWRSKKHTLCMDKMQQLETQKKCFFAQQQQLEQAVCDIDPSRCQTLLEAGADPNYIRAAGCPANLIQLCGFRLSDCCLTDAQQADLTDILEMLIRFGAKVTQNDVDYFMWRYGVPCADDGDFTAAMYQVLVGEETKHKK